MVSIGLVSIPKLVTPRRLSLVLLVVYLVYMVAMYMKDLNEEKDQVQVARVVALKTSNSSKDKSVVLLLNGEGVSKADVEEGNRGEDEGGGGEGEGKEELEAGEELPEEKPQKHHSWLNNKTEVRLWIGETNRNLILEITSVFS